MTCDCDLDATVVPGEQVQSLMGCLLYADRLDRSPYSALLSEDLWHEAVRCVAPSLIKNTTPLMRRYHTMDHGRPLMTLKLRGWDARISLAMSGHRPLCTRTRK